MKTKYYFWNTTRESVKNLIEGIFGIGLLSAFCYYRLYAAAVVIALLLILLAGVQLRLICISSEGIKQIKWFRVDTFIPIDDVERINTTAGKSWTNVCIYGVDDILEMPYRKSTFASLLGLLGIEKNMIDSLLMEDKVDFCRESGDYLIKRETVALDDFIGKKKFIHREITSTKVRHIRDENGTADNEGIAEDESAVKA